MTPTHSILPNACGSSDDSGIEPVKAQPPQAHIPLADVQGCRLAAGAGANLSGNDQTYCRSLETVGDAPDRNNRPAHSISSALNRGVPSPTHDGGSMIPAAASPEDSIQERGGLFQWLVFHAAAVWASVTGYLENLGSGLL